MAALSATELQDAIIMVDGKKFNEFEGRLSKYGALKAFLDGANSILPESTVTSMKKSEKQPEKVPVLNKFNSTVLTARTCSITGPTRVSAFKALSYVTKGFEIVVSDAINAGNYISRSEDFAWQMIQGLKAVYNSLDLAAVAALETNRNTSLVTSSLSTITNAAGDYEENLLSDIYYDMPALMALNDLDDGRIQNVTNTEAKKEMLKYESQGQNNAIDLAGVLSGKFADASDYRHYLTNNITLGTNREVHYLFPEGAVGLFVWNAFEFQKRATNGISRFYTQQDPILGINWNVYETTDCVELSTLAAGMTGTGYVTKYQFSADFSYLTAYSSDTNTPIVKVISKKTPVSS
jgi:LysM repeat protein